MKELCGKKSGRSRSWAGRMLDFFFQAEACRCSGGTSGCPLGADQECSCSGNEMCAMKEWTEADEAAAALEPDQPTLSTVRVGSKARIQQIFLPLAQKKRLLSLGLTNGTKVGVISNEKGRMIVAVRDSRLGLSPEVASRITYRSA